MYNNNYTYNIIYNNIQQTTRSLNFSSMCSSRITSIAFYYTAAAVFAAGAAAIVFCCLYVYTRLAKTVFFFCIFAHL